MNIKIFTLIFCATLALVQLRAQEYITDPQRQDFTRYFLNDMPGKSKISIFKAVRSGSFKAKLPEKLGHKIGEAVFDSTGVLTEITHYVRYPNISERLHFPIGHKGNFLVNKYNGSNTKIYSWEYQDSILTREVKYSPNGAQKFEWLMVYNSDTTLQSLEKRTADKEQVYFKEYEYNAKKELIQNTTLLNGELLSKRIFQRDKAGNIIGMKFLDSNDEATATWNKIVQGDSLSTKIVHKSTKKKKFNWSVEYFYEEDGNLSRKNFYDRKGRLDGSVQFEYNENGKLTKYTKDNANVKTEEIKYQYDQDNNLVEKQVFVRSYSQLMLGLKRSILLGEMDEILRIEELYPLRQLGVVYTYIYE